MKFREVFRFELAYQIRRISTWLFFAAMVVFAFLVVRFVYISDARSGVHLLNAPLVVIGVMVFGGVVWLLLAAAVSGEAAARDVETRMDPLTYTAPVSKADYLAGRFLAAFVLNGLILLGLPIGILLALAAPGVEPGLLGPFRPAAYLTAYLFIALPNAFVATAIQFSWAALTRRGISAYLASGFLLFTSHFAMSAVASLLGRWDLTKLLDVLGVIGIMAGHVDTWSPIERNTRLIQLEGPLLGNRLIWHGAAVLTLAFTYFRFRLGHHKARRSLRARLWSRIPRFRAGRLGGQEPQRSALAATTAITRISIPQVRPAFGFATHARQTLAIAWDSFRTVARSRAGLALVAIFVVPGALFASVFITFQGIALFPRTGALIGLLAPPLTELQNPWVIIPLLILYYAGELLWREREAGVSEITDAAPVPEWAFLLGKYLGLGFVIAAWLAFVIATGLLIQWDRSYQHLEIGLYLKAIFGLQFANYLLFALLVLAVHVLMNQKYLGHLAALIAYASIAFAPRLGFSHNLLVYARRPGWSYTDMSGFEPSLAPWLWFTFYWAAWALQLAVIARLSWVRGSERGVEWRLQLAQRRFTRPTARTAAVAAGPILGVGGFIFYNTNILNAYRSASETTDRLAEYERRYRRYAGIPQPRLAATNLNVEIYPRLGKADIRGTYRLVNRSAQAIDAIHLATVPGVETRAVAFDRPATRVVADDELGYQVHALEKPLQPGDSLQVSFEVRLQPHGFGNDGVDAPIVANGTYFKNLSVLPLIGYQPDRELRNAGERRLRGLPARADIPSLDDVAARSVTEERAAFEAVVSTDEEQTAVAPGTLRRSWNEGGRRYFHYVADAPIANEYAFYSAAYAVHEARWNDVAIQIFHHPGHAENVERIARSVQAALDYNTRLLGPYPYRSFKVVEHPGPGRGMHADAGTIDHEEGFALMDPASRPQGLDLPFWVVAHEVAHQWWGKQALPAFVEGGGVLAETLANYSALRVVENTYGREHMLRVVGMWRAFYEIPRTRAATPLLRATEPFQYRRKASLAMYALSEYIGAERVDEALRRLFRKHSSGAPPLPTSLDLYAELQAVTPDALKYLLHDLFAANTFWELKTEQATAGQTAAGSWQVTLDVQARKVVVDEAGTETEVPMNDWVEIGVSAAADADKPYLQKHRLRSGRQTITVTMPLADDVGGSVPGAPKPGGMPIRAGVDPQQLLVDLNPDDNTATVRAKR